MTGFARAYRYLGKTRNVQKTKRWLKRRAHRRARRGDGVVRLNERDVT